MCRLECITLSMFFLCSEFLCSVYIVLAIFFRKVADVIVLFGVLRHAFYPLTNAGGLQQPDVSREADLSHCWRSISRQS